MKLKISRFERNKAIYAYLFILVPVIFLMIFWVYPVVISMTNSLFKWDLANPRIFVGLANYKEMFTDLKFWNAVKVTLIYAFSTITPTIIIALLLAVMLSKKVWLRSLLRSIYFLPWTIAFLAVAIIWKWLYNPSFGLINHIFNWFHISGVNWLNNSNTALLSLIIVGIWWGLGYDLIIYLAAIQSIDQQLYEAAQIDGANEWSKFRHITFPSITEANIFVVIVSVINGFQIFDSPYAMTKGGPASATKTIVLYIYETAIKNFEFGYACTLSLLLFVVVMLISIFTLRIFSRK
jgi:multiple sugar transport system permease protein